MAWAASPAAKENALGRVETEPPTLLAFVSLTLEEVSWLVYLKSCYCKKKILAKINSKVHKIRRNTPWCKLFMKRLEQHDQELAWLTVTLQQRRAPHQQTRGMCVPVTNVGFSGLFWGIHQTVALNPERAVVVLGVGRGCTEEVSQRHCF